VTIRDFDKKPTIEGDIRHMEHLCLKLSRLSVFIWSKWHSSEQLLTF